MTKSLSISCTWCISNLFRFLLWVQIYTRLQELNTAKGASSTRNALYSLTGCTGGKQTALVPEATQNASKTTALTSERVVSTKKFPPDMDSLTLYFQITKPQEFISIARSILKNLIAPFFFLNSAFALLPLVKSRRTSP